VNTTMALTTHGLGKRYGPRWALRNVDLCVPAGSVAALVGPNGAGKTTLLHLVMGLLEPTEGGVEVFGARAAANTPAALARVGFVAQDHPLYGYLRVGELLRFAGATNRTFDTGYARGRLQGLGIDLHRKASRLSGGQQAQVALVLALAKRPRLLVLDEPVASLDPLARREFLSVLMDEVADGQVSVVLSSHVVAELQRIADHLIVLTHGQVRLAGPAEEIIATHRLLTGPNAPHAVAGLGQVIAARQFARHSQLLLRTTTDDTATHPAWQAQPVSMEEIVLAYLQSPEPAPAELVSPGVA
jgi:ABC-2 type transport system ATP-binding protein